METLLQGRMSGVGVNIQSGSPGGGGTNVAVRGYNSLWLDEAGGGDGSPLYVIDGGSRSFVYFPGDGNEHDSGN